LTAELAPPTGGADYLEVTRVVHHKFTVGQEVEFLPGRMDFHVPRGIYTIVRQLPLESNDFLYRVKNVRDGHERVMRESQLAPWSMPRESAPREASQSEKPAR
jgi:hypothetical protein